MALTAVTDKDTPDAQNRIFFLRTGATDEIGFHAIEDRHYVTDIHATVLHQMGLDPRQMLIPGRKRLEIDYGQPIRQIIA